MGKRFAFAALGVVALGAVAMALVFLETRSPLAPRSASAEPPAFDGGDPSRLSPAPVPLPPPAAPVQPAATAAVRAAPVDAPEFKERLESPDPEERSDAMLEVRKRRKANMMGWLNRRRNPAN